MSTPYRITSSGTLYQEARSGSRFLGYVTRILRLSRPIVVYYKPGYYGAHTSERHIAMNPEALTDEREVRS